MCHFEVIIKDRVALTVFLGVSVMKRFALAAAAVLSFAIPSIANATTINIANSGFSMGSRDGIVNVGSGPFDGANASFGQFVLSGVNVTAANAPVTYYTYCVDLFHALLIPGTFTIQPLSTLFNATKEANITKILANVTPTNADQSAAVQLAIWEIAFDTGAGNSVMTGGAQGNFFVNGGSSNPTAQTLANSYLANLGSWTIPTGTTASLLYSQNNQTQVFLNAVAVPEAGTWVMMIAGFGIAGVSMRRRKSAAALSLV
jgi:PEP-CTERM motif/Thioester domain